MSESEVRMRDFTKAPRKLAFKAENDVFDCYDEIDPASLQEAIKLIEVMQGDFARTADFFDRMMDAENAKRFRARMAPGPDAIGLHRALAIATWLVEEHAQRPTMPSVDSIEASQTGTSGTSSTDGAVRAE